MSQTLVGGRGVATSRAGVAAIVKAVCPACRFTTYVVDVDGARVETDAELLAVIVVADDGTARRVNARRLHADTCAALHPPARPRVRSVVDTYKTVDARTSAFRTVRTSDKMSGQRTTVSASLVACPPVGRGNSADVRRPDEHAASSRRAKHLSRRDHRGINRNRKR